MAERMIAPILKIGLPQKGNVGSNPTSSALSTLDKNRVVELHKLMLGKRVSINIDSNMDSGFDSRLTPNYLLSLGSKS